MDLNKVIFDRDYEVITLSNGLRVGYKHLDIPDTKVLTRVIEGSSHEPVDKKGILHFIEHLFYRSQDGSDIKKDLFNITGRDNPYAYTGPETMFFSARMPNEDFPDYLRLWSDALKRTKYHEKGFEIEKNVILNEISPNEVKGSLVEYALNLRKNHLYPGHALGRNVPGDTSSVSTITPEDISKYKSERVNASNTFITIVGGVDKDGLVTLLQDNLGDFKEGEKNKLLYDDVPDIIPLEEIKRSREISTNELDIYYRIPSQVEEDFIYMKIMNKYLAGGMSSRLQQSLREERGLVYGISMDSIGLINPDIGYILARNFKEPDYKLIDELIFQEIDLVKQGDIDNELLEQIKKGYSKRFWQNTLESLTDKANNIDFKETSGVNYGLDRILEIWQTVEPKDLSRIAQRIFDDKYVKIGYFPENN